MNFTAAVFLVNRDARMVSVRYEQDGTGGTGDDIYAGNG